MFITRYSYDCIWKSKYVTILLPNPVSLFTLNCFLWHVWHGLAWDSMCGMASHDRSSMLLCIRSFYQYQNQITCFFSDQILTLMDSDEGSFQEYHTHCNTLSSLTFSPSGNEFISASENNFHVWKYNERL